MSATTEEQCYLDNETAMVGFGSIRAMSINSMCLCYGLASIMSYGKLLKAANVFAMDQVSTTGCHTRPLQY